MTEPQFTEFYEATRRRVLAYLVRASGNLSLAEDLMQESYIRFLSSAPPGLAVEEATRYVFRTASNLLVDHWRGNKVEFDEVNPERHAGPRAAPEAHMDLRSAFTRLLRDWAADNVDTHASDARFLWLVAEDRKAARRAARMQVAMACAAAVVAVLAGFAAWSWQLLGPGLSTGGIAAALVIAVLFANWYASDSALPVHQ